MSKHDKLTKVHRLMLIDMLIESAPRELELDLSQAMLRRSHIRLASETYEERMSPVPMADGTVKNLPTVRRVKTWELTRAGANVARQLHAIKVRGDAAREKQRAALELEFPIGTEVAIVHTEHGGQAYRADDIPDGARVVVRGRVVEVTSMREIKVEPFEVAPIAEIPVEVALKV